MKDIKAVIFDMDGVIFDTERMYLEIWTEVFKKYGYNMTKEVYVSVMGTGKNNVIKMFVERYGEELPIDKMYKEKDEIFALKIDNGEVKLKDGVYEILDFLRKNNYKIALATSAKRERTDKHLKHAGITGLFDAVVCGDEIEKSKPEPEIFLKAAEKLDMKSINCIVVEDSESGVKAGYSAGMKVINIPDLIDSNNEMRSRAHKVLTSLYEFKEYIDNSI